MPDGLFGTRSRLPPTNTDAEQALLGAILANNKAYRLVSDFLSHEHFANLINGRIYEAAAKRIEAGQVADTVTLKSDFENSGVLDGAGGAPYLTELVECMVGIINSGDYGRAIYDCWQRREALEIADYLSETAYNGSLPMDEGAAEAAGALDRLCHGSQSSRRGTALADAAEEALEQGKLAAERAEKIAAGTLEDTIVRTGLSIDDRLGELEPGGIYVIGALPGGGKSAWSLQVAIYNALRGVPVHYSSTEMHSVQLARRALSHLSGVSARTIKQGSWNTFQQTELGTAAINLAKFRDFFLIEDSPGLNTKIIGAQARTFARRFKGKKGLLVIDHMHDLSEFSESDMLKAVGSITSGVKLISKQIGWPIILLAQLSRNADRRESKRPEMGDLYGGRKIEAIAEAICLLHRPDMYLDPFPPTRKDGENSDAFNKRDQEWNCAWNTWRGIVQGYVVKARDAEQGVERWRFDGARNRFIDAPLPPDGH